ncbi:autotransporter outer membrane beta-barrel domain-containing protein [Ancylobacter sp. SL191]|uniref:autotransporter outer membrane beta-barrel domain-containing protein n=1 Tax=Ancylobacter sp. SL191 TaxID=2995166 RepID=UPI00226FC05A|nr:autotransporter outer membrane beta-barrel domain-containing protein [Ancylobacter sp. SL191]WAC26632.1 hypothetical protein OU996_16685 [Ancylobacter sp. SL191]
MAASVAIGGSGASGGDGASVQVTQNGAIRTGSSGAFSDQSAGIIAQSIGGSGGNGGSADANAAATTASVALAIGGGGASGGSGNGVTVSSNQNGGNGITTIGLHASAILAQSIGGGGGNGGWTQATASSNDYAAGLAIGGFGAGGGDAGTVTVNSGGMLLTYGALSYGILAQSIGGGGGNGGAASSTTDAGAGQEVQGGVTSVAGAGAGQDASTVSSAVSGSSDSQPESSDDGAVSGIAASVTIGGFGGLGGTGAAVTVTNTASILTYGDQASGILAQSIGGGGGNGGASNANANGDSYAASFSLGGGAGDGGDGGGVTITSSGSIQTFGLMAAGLFAQSVGGGGGKGGSSSSTASSGGQAAVSMNLGASGGSGGDGGAVSVSSSVLAYVNTLGPNAAGIFAQSVGGGGGNGGSSVASSSVSSSSSASGSSSSSTGSLSGSASGSETSASAGASGGNKGSQSGSDGGYSLAMSLGGGGGTGGAGGNVTVTNAYVIVTGVDLTGSTTMIAAGDHSSALFAQSVGGGGGNGGSSTTNSSASEASVALSIGGAGSGAGAGGTVGVTTQGTLYTVGYNSSAVFAQSVGGGGGSGGASSTTSGAGGTASIALGLGGSGSGGGAGGNVTVTVTAPASWSGVPTGITTLGDSSYGVFAQSVGGGGGAGGALVSAATAPSNSGGSGSSSSSASSTSTSTSANDGVALAMGLGGSGGGGGAGGAVQVTLDAQITTLGAHAAGLFAQSVGGGGGAGGASTVNASNSTYALAFGLGGSGSAGGIGGDVTATANEAISTQGVQAYGLLAQSVGGGGGAAGASTGGASGGTEASFDMALGGSAGTGQTGGTVTVTTADTISTTGAAAVALLAQSVGGGGGVGAASSSSLTSGSVTGTLTLAGTGGTGNDGGSVSVTAAGISTSGGAAFGILAQSIGGGGGVASVSTGSAMASGLATTLGGAGSGAGGTVTLSTSGAIATTGNAAIGILAQSIGGGGGVANAGASVTFAGPSTASNGGAVEVTLGGSLTTTGTNAVGVLAQSIGGGGGAAISDGQAASWTASGGTGTGGAVTVNVNGTISTTGAGAYGVIAQSVSNGGGLVMNGTSMELVNGSTAASGKVVVNLASSTAVSATGAGAVGVLMQGNGDPIINVAQGASVIGGVGGTAIVSDGTENFVNNDGWIATVDGGEGMAVITTGGYSAITNGGSLLGSLSLADGFLNSLVNLSTGTIYAGSSLDLGGPQAVLRNDGVLRRGTTTLGMTAIDGSLVQGATGSLVVRTDQISLGADQFTVSGTAQLAGAIVGRVYRPGLAMPGAFSVPFLTAADGISWSSLTAMGDTAILDFSLSGSSALLSLDTHIDFTPAGLSPDAQEVGETVAVIQTRGSSGLFQAIVPALLEIPTVDRLETSYQTLGGGAVSLVPQSMINATSAAMASVTDQMDNWRLRQRHAAPSITTGPAGRREADAAPYVWGAPIGSSTTGGGLSGTLLGITIGTDGELPDLPLLAGFAGNFSSTNLSADEYGASTSTAYGGFSAYGVYEMGQAYISAIATLGYGSADFERNLYGLGLNLATDADLDGTLLGGRVEVGYSFALGDTGATLTPFAAFQPMQLWLGSGTESFGALGAGLTYHDSTITALPVYLGVQFDSLWHGKDGTTYAPFVRAAWMHDFSPDRNVSRSFAEAPDLTFSGTPIPVVSDALDLHAGLKVNLGGNMSFSAGFDAQIGDGYSVLGASGSLRLRW